MTLQEWMDLKGWKDGRLAQEVGGVSRSQISRVRRTGKTSLALARKLAIATELPLEDIVRPRRPN